MRTTLTIGEETDSRLRRIAREQNRSYKDVINDALVLGLAKMEVKEAAPAYQVETFDAGLAPGIDRHKLNQLVDELDAEA